MLMSVKAERLADLKDPYIRPVELHGIRWETFEAILEDVSEHQRTGLAYDNGTLRFTRSVLYDVRWSTFEAILEDLGDRRGLRLSYDDGRLEFMSPSRRHDSEKTRIGRMVEMFTFELRIPVSSGGSVTLRRTGLTKGVEADECYWIGRESAVRGKEELDLATDPAPDLAIEVDVSHSSLPNLEVYAALGVPEVWRFEDGSLFIYELQPSGQYSTRSDSQALPGLSAADVERFVRMSESMDETSWMYAFRDWVRDEVAPRRGGGAGG
jgi:Uma2 family endonuclease